MYLSLPIKTMRTTSIIILAAGASTRLGKPKQLLPWEGSTLLQHAVQVAGHLTPKPIVVLGAHLEKLEAVLDPSTVEIVHNTAWKEGIASSIRIGLQTAIKQQPQQVIFMVCDQPFVSAHLLEELLLAHQKTGKPIIASAYAGTVGIPALFQSAIFPQLLDLEGDTGAKKIIQQNSGLNWAVPFPMGHIDIDSGEDFDVLGAP
jgi:molybdenum cofactor cytidylyltransferase